MNGVTQMTEQDQIAAFVARRGVTRVAEGVRITTGRGLYAAVRGDNALIEERHVVYDHLGQIHVRNSLGEWIA